MAFVQALRMSYKKAPVPFSIPITLFLVLPLIFHQFMRQYIDNRTNPLVLFLLILPWNRQLMVFRWALSAQIWEYRDGQPMLCSFKGHNIVRYPFVQHFWLHVASLSPCHTFKIWEHKELNMNLLDKMSAILTRLVLRWKYAPVKTYVFVFYIYVLYRILIFLYVCH